MPLMVLQADLRAAYALLQTFMIACESIEISSAAPVPKNIVESL